ncbi:uncharacterized protein SPPG_06047 [Spizellomyces punctatus DAOM BR117]|uniref:Uncharacterized protein n=1 Tax=Spizellomyces punctatus (strain DAOM BR117) TaxID=645134 RepID=A0A0L0HEE3_SPIPD|nr:uncharacterized protein SPPG_06047 [Spizellomyces punctatus DAOM BR117]KNC99103.1 hypothetical protein SPPG_06047 [Spizellomyces punctatus DAOM BR117]|eukprot:XP_016607143.1 hypothetical protein SPPG_06047 [Spizellomyces punctatus DAOM BR117]
MNLPISIAISLSTVFWIRELFGLSIRWWSKDTWWPVLAYMVWNFIVYSIFALIPLFPVPFMPVYGGGLAYSVVPPLITYLFCLPTHVKAQPDFLKKFASSIIVSGSLNVYWFVLFGFYFAFINTPNTTGLQIMLLAIIKIFTVVFGGIQVKLVHSVARLLGHKEGENIGALAKLFIETAFETYIFLVIPDMHDWAVFGFWLALDISCLFLELFHKYETALDIVLSRFGRLKISHLGSSEDLEETIRVRTKHYLVSVVSKVFGTCVFSTLLATWYYGPNKEWYPIFASFPEAVVTDAIFKAWLALAAILIHLMGTLAVFRYRGVPVAKYARQFFGRYAPLFVGIYLCAPIFPFTHMGKHWYCLEYMWEVVHGTHG